MMYPKFHGSHHVVQDNAARRTVMRPSRLAAGMTRTMRRHVAREPHYPRWVKVGDLPDHITWRWEETGPNGHDCMSLDALTLAVKGTLDDLLHVRRIGWRTRAGGSGRYRLSEKGRAMLARLKYTKRSGIRNRKAM